MSGSIGSTGRNRRGEIYEHETARLLGKMLEVRIPPGEPPGNRIASSTVSIPSDFDRGVVENDTRLGLRRRPRVLLVHPFAATFVERDKDLLETFCEVRSILFDRRARYPLLLRSILSADVVVCWFALPFAVVASTVARALGRKAIVIAGGWDVSRMPEIGYGRLLGRRARFLARIALTSANLVLAFSESSMRSILDIAPLSTVRKAYMGVDIRVFVPKQKENIVVTIGNVSRENIVRKGFQTFIEAAAHVPEGQFILIGKHVDNSVDDLRAMAPGNVTIPGWLPDRDVRDVLARARVYVQASYTEGFGVALAEAMSSGCVPIVTQRGAIPEVVGDTGFYFEYGDSVALGKAIRNGLRSDLGLEARQRVAELFGIDQRLVALRDAIATITGGPR